MVGVGCGIIRCLAEDEFGRDISIDWECNMSESDKEYIRGLNIKPINYSFTGKKAVIYDQFGNVMDQWFEVRGLNDCGFSTYAKFE